MDKERALTKKLKESGLVKKAAPASTYASTRTSSPNPVKKMTPSKAPTKMRTPRVMTPRRQTQEYIGEVCWDLLEFPLKTLPLNLES